jgi:hypothetical protein
VKASILSAALAFAFAAALPAQAQSTNPTGPDNKSTQKAGEAYPNDKTAGTNKGKPETVKKVENSRPVQATKNVARKTGNAVSNTAKSAADATRRTGDKIADKLPGDKTATPQR